MYVRIWKREGARQFFFYGANYKIIFNFENKSE